MNRYREIKVALDQDRSTKKMPVIVRGLRGNVALIELYGRTRYAMHVSGDDWRLVNFNHVRDYYAREQGK